MMLVPSLMTLTLFVSLQKLIQRPSATNLIGCHRIIESTPLFASSTFGQLVSVDLEFSGMNEPSCPCCSFGGKSLFLPWGDTNDVDVERVRITDETTLSSAAVDVLSPSEAWQAIISARADASQQQQPIALVDTHGHPHLERSVEYAIQEKDEEILSHNDQTNIVVSITCAVSPVDWNDALDYSCRSQHILPALGIHPWYLSDILMKDIVESNIEESTTDEPANIEQYLNWDWLNELEAKLSQHPNLIVGEIGLCKMARFVREFPKALGGKATALQLQKIVFKKQMELAAQWRRPVTVHCVNAHGLLMETLEEIFNEARESCSKEEQVHSTSNNLLQNDGLKTTLRKAFPPAIAMHSFTGTAHHVQQILDFERSILYPELVEAERKKQRGKKKQQKRQNAEENEVKGDTDILFYFGFSHSVNYIMCTSEKAKRKGIEAVQAIPSDRLLVESDVHATEDVILGTAGATSYAAHARGESLQDVAETSTINGLRFISSLSS